MLMEDSTSKFEDAVLDLLREFLARRERDLFEVG